MPKADDVVVDVVVQETPEQILASQKDGFTEAVSSTHVASATEIAAQTKTDEEAAIAAAEAAAKLEAETVAAKASAEEAIKAAVPGLTSEQVNALVKSQLSGVYGKFGGIEQKLKELTEAKSAGVQLTAEDVTDLEKEYGPELAGALLKTLNKFGAKIGGGSGDAKVVHAVDEKAELAASISAAKQELADKLQTTERAIELKFLNREHKDWKTVVRSFDAQGNDLGIKPEFKAWVDTLPVEDQTRVLQSWDAEFLSEKIGEYKKHLAAQVAPKAIVKPATVSNRLKTATVPQSVPGTISVKSALDEQREGYASA